jgi:hypothetical protein
MHLLYSAPEIADYNLIASGQQQFRNCDQGSSHQNQIRRLKMPEIGDITLLQSSSLSDDALETYQGYANWDDDKNGKRNHSGQPSMFFTRSDAQAAKQGFTYGLLVGLAHRRLTELHLYGLDEQTIKDIESLHAVHGRTTLDQIIPLLKEKGYGIREAKNDNAWIEVTMWVDLAKK